MTKTIAIIHRLLAKVVPEQARRIEELEAARQPVGLTEEQVRTIHEIIEKHSTDVVDYVLATDDINAALNAAKRDES